MQEKPEPQETPPVEIIEIDAKGYHGGAWKVAYADFVTAMMAFFLLMWLLNMAPSETLTYIASYFEPTPHPKVSMAESGAGGVMGGLTMSPKGSMASNVQPIAPPTQTPSNAPAARQDLNADDADEQTKEDSGQNQNLSPAEQAIEQQKEVLRQQEQEQFEQTKQLIEYAIKETPGLEEMLSNLIIDTTPEGLRVQIVDKEGRAMFPSGSADMYPYMRELLVKITDVITPLPNKLSLRGHTDAVPFGRNRNYTNWELSTDRAHASRRVIQAAGMPEDRIHDVLGKAATDPILPDDPTNAQNRRISIILLRQELTDPNFGRDGNAPLPARTTPPTQDAPSQPVEQPATEGQSQSGSNQNTRSGSPSSDSVNGRYNGNGAPPAIQQRRFRKTPGDVEFP